MQSLLDRGFSLVEAVLASFILLTAVAMSAYVFDSSLRAEASNESRVIASLVAESALAEVRNAAMTDYGTLASFYDGRSWILVEYPHFDISCKVIAQNVAIPCTELERQYSDTATFPDPARRYLRNTVARVEVEVRWDDEGRNSLTISELITDFSPSTSFLIEILLADGSIANSTTLVSVDKDDVVDFSARARRSASGPIIEDLQFTWYVQPLTGFGSIHSVGRDGINSQYRNAYRNYDNALKYSPGLCNLVVKGSYQGNEVEGMVRIENKTL